MVQVDGEAVERLAMTAITDITRTEASVIVIKHGQRDVLDVEIITNKQDQSHMDACRQWHQVDMQCFTITNQGGHGSCLKSLL